MIDGLFEVVASALAALAMFPLGFFFPCNPCCGGCGVADGKPRTDPANEGTWVPSGTWRGVGGVTWTFTANPGDNSGETWFFYGSFSTSKVGGGATVAEREDWGNICNWYSNKTTSPSTLTGLPGAFNKRATRLPPVDAVVHIYTSVSTVTAGPQTVKYAYFWGAAAFNTGSEITLTAAAHDSDGGAVFNNNSENFGTVNGGATLNDSFFNFGGIINGGAVFNDFSYNFYRAGVGVGVFVSGTVNGGSVFNDSSENAGVVNDGAVFNDDSVHYGANSPSSFGSVNGGAVFNDNSQMFFSTVNDGAVFNGSTKNQSGLVNGGGVFNDSSENSGTVNGGATFNSTSRNLSSGTVNGGATFNDAACSERETGNFGSVPCDRKFVAHPTDLPTCNGTAPDGCANPADTCGCG